LAASPHLHVPPARMLASQQPQRATTRHVAVERHFSRDTRQVRRECLAKERLCSGDTAFPAQQEVDGLAVLVDGAIKVVPFGFDRDVRLVHSPRCADGLGESAPPLLELRDVPRVTHLRIVEWATLTPRSAIISTRSRYDSR
jgi:hypothetical protein